jgi:hypothetical protein
MQRCASRTSPERASAKANYLGEAMHLTMSGKQILQTAAGADA